MMPMTSWLKNILTNWRSWVLSRLLKVVLAFILGVGLINGWGQVGLAVLNPPVTTIKVYNRSVGMSTRYIGVCEGNVNFNIADLTDLGINTYRIYGGMSRWEPEDDDGVYGLPTIAQIKANPDVILWDRWDAVMTHPETGSDYAFSGNPSELWQGSAKTIFETLKQAQIRPVLTIRNTDPGWGPDWALQLNPPRTEADWNEWWEHVFATVYWLNVRNDYRVDDFEIHNEPDNREQGWGGNQQDYFELLRVATDAISYVYDTYLPDRTAYIHAPKTVGGSRWPGDILAAIPTYFNSVNVHNYDWDVAPYVRQVRQWMQGTRHAKSPLWLGEWGTYSGGYTDLGFSLNLIKNMMQMSQPGDTYVYGSHIFSLYDWGKRGDFEGLVSARGDHRLSYYAFRMGIRALQGGKSVILTEVNDNSKMAIATQSETGELSLLVVNDQPVDLPLSVDVSAWLADGEGRVWEFSQYIQDELVETMSIQLGQVNFTLPAYSSRLVVVHPIS